jgi:TonB family protein
MRRNVMLTLLVIALSLPFAQGQEPGQKGMEVETCSGPVYEKRAVSRPAQYHLPQVRATDGARPRVRSGFVTASAVLCRDGRVTDIVVAKGSPSGYVRRVVEAVRGMRFTPAEKDGEAVSQKVQLEYHYNVR